MTKLYIFIFILFISNICYANEYTERLPDSINTIEHTYIYCLEDPGKAQAIMDELRRRKIDPEWQLDWCQADLCYNTGKAITTFLDMIDIAKQPGNTAEIGRGYMFIGALALGEKNEMLAEEYFTLAEKQP